MWWISGGGEYDPLACGGATREAAWAVGQVLALALLKVLRSVIGEGVILRSTVHVLARSVLQVLRRAVLVHEKVRCRDVS